MSSSSDRDPGTGTSLQPTSSLASGFEDAFTVDAQSSDERLAAAAAILTNGTGVVMLEHSLVLRPMPTYLSCEVVDPTPSARRCEHELDVLVENAQLLLRGSRLLELLPDLPRRWSLVADYGNGDLRPSGDN